MADRHNGREPRDDVDSWLNERIDPLLPPPGTFDLIKRRARRRKYRKLAITASTAAVLVAAAVTVPQVVNLPVLSPAPTSSPAAGSAAGRTPSAPASAPVNGTASAAVSAASPVATVPPDFKPTSVTFVGPHTGWVIGQAGTPGHCATQYCTSVARTNDAGRTWSGVPAPLTGAPDGATGVGQIRFLDLTDGWAFGPGLFVTHSAGKAWTAVETGGLRVTDLETVGTRVFALWASCTGTGGAYASGCSTFTLYSAPASGGSWAPVGAATTGLTYGQSGQAPSLVLTSSRGYLLTADGTLYSGPVDGSAAWRKQSSLPDACDVGGTGAGGQPNGALLGAANASDLLLTCLIPGSKASEQKLVYSSPNRGASWLALATAPPAGIAASLAASPSESLMLATDRGIERLPKGEIAWQPATLAGPAPAGGFSYVGMTDDEQGIALPADPGAGTVWFTFDGGQTWKPSPLTGS